MIIRIRAQEKRAKVMAQKIEHMIRSGGGTTVTYTEPVVPENIDNVHAASDVFKTTIIIHPTVERERHGNEAKG